MFSCPFYILGYAYLKLAKLSIMIRISLFIFFFISTFPMMAQGPFNQWIKPRENRKIEPFVMVQLWGNYTFNQEIYNQNSGVYEAVDNRWNMVLRRARLGFRAEPYSNLKFTLTTAYDMIGRDLLSGLNGGKNNGSLPNIGVWDAFFQWRIKPESEAFNLIGGYFRPQFSRESITSAWSITSMEKAMSQNYIRKHLTGIGSGRALGLNLGGLLKKEDAVLGINYNVGIFNPVSLAFDGNSVGTSFAPLIVARSVFTFGDPEMTNYKIGYDINYYSQRRGFSLALAGAWQGQTDRFKASYATGVDALFNWGPVNIDGEWSLMWRKGTSDTKEFTHNYQAGHIRLGYNVIMANRFFLEPTFMLMAFNGAMSTPDQLEASLIGASAGEERTFDLGINWYLDKKRLKLMIHYTWRSGNTGEAIDGNTVNNLFSQSGLGAIKRGNWLGLGINAIF